MESTDPLFDFCVSLMTNEFQNLDVTTTSFLRSDIAGHLDGALDYSEFRALVLERCGTASFIDRIHDILTVPAQPLPDHRAALAGFDYSGARNKTRSWNTQEDNRLLAAVRKYGLGAGSTWSTIADFVGNGRTRSQCSQRWIRVLDPRICNQQWNREEDQSLLSLVAQHGEKAWMKIATLLGNRSDVQCRYRYFQLQKCGQDQRPDVHTRQIEEPIELRPLDIPETLSIPLASSMDLKRSDSLFDSNIWMLPID
jgi:hypothetical protein